MNLVKAAIITCDQRRGVFEETLKDFTSKTSFTPAIINKKVIPGMCHKGRNERGVFKWGDDNLGEGDWLLRLEDDVVTNPKAEEIIYKLIHLEEPSLFILGDVVVPYTREVEVNGLRFRELKNDIKGIQAMLVPKRFLGMLAESNLNKPSDLKIFKYINPRRYKVWQLVSPILFSHQPVDSICWPNRKIPMEVVSNE